MNASASRRDELAAMVREIRERVRARHPQGNSSGLDLPDLMAVVRARDMAEGKVAAIGTVNPRPPGFVHDVIQGVKGLVARSLNWLVREQVNFNRATIASIEAILEAQNETNRALAELARRIEAGSSDREGERAAQWAAWRSEWDRRVNDTESRLSRAMAELASMHELRSARVEAGMANSDREVRATLASVAASIAEVGKQHAGQAERLQHAWATQLQEALQREAAVRQSELERLHADFSRLHHTHISEVQQKLWSDIEGLEQSIHRHYQAALHEELALVRQRLALSARAASSEANATEAVPIDWLRFAKKFRGPEEKVQQHVRRYVPRFPNGALDIGCGRGEFLAVLQEAGIRAQGIDLSDENVAICRGKGLDASLADAFEYLPLVPDASLSGIFCSQVIEHLQPAQLPRLINLCAAKLKRGAAIVLETPNAACLAILASHFYLDPTHVRPVPAPLLSFYLEEAGFGAIQVESLSPALEEFPSLAELPPSFRETFFDGLDIAVSAVKL